MIESDDISVDCWFNPQLITMNEITAYARHQNSFACGVDVPEAGLFRRCQNGG